MFLLLLTVKSVLLEKHSEFDLWIRISELEDKAYHNK